MFNTSLDIRSLKRRVQDLERKLEILTCQHDYIPHKVWHGEDNYFYYQECSRCGHREYITVDKYVELESSILENKIKVTMAQLEGLKNEQR